MSYAQLPTPAVTLIPSVLNEEGELIERGRVKDPGQLVSAHQELWNADFEASRSRAMVQAMVDGQPPYKETGERLRGTAGRTNVNWGLAAQVLSEAEAPYNELVDGLDVFGTTPTNYGDEAMRSRYSAIIAEEITRMLRSWDDFADLWAQNVHLFVMEGLSFAFFEDDVDWRWRVVGQQFLKFPRRVRANVNEVDLFTCQLQMLPHQLFRKIQNEEAARDVGWEPTEVRAALKTASPKGLQSNDPQEWERAWKDNDIVFGVTAATVEVVQAWVRELDGSVSHYICRADGQGGWMYKCDGKYKSMKRLLIDYRYGVGANGDFQSIRGLGQVLFNSSGALNRFMCKLLDMAVHTSTPVVVADDEDTFLDQALIPEGPYLKLTSGFSFAEQKVPNFDQTLLPAMQMLQDVFRMRSQPYSAAASGQIDRTQRTAKEIQIKTEQSGKLSTSGINSFFRSWGEHFKEFVRRVINPEYTQDHPGGQEVWEFRKRCLKRGVPLEAIYQVDVEGIEVNMGFGKGSVTERRAVVSVLNETLYYRADQFGQQKINNMTAAAYVGSRIADELFPSDPNLRPPVDLQIALLENTQMAQTSQMAEVVPNQDHIVHVATHLQKLFELNQALTDTTILLEQAIPQMMPIWQHAGQHMQFVDPMNPASKEFKQALQQLGEVITNGQKHLDAEAKRQQKEAGMDGDAESYGGVPASLYKQAVQAQSGLDSLQLDVEKQKQELEFDAAKRTQDLTFRDAEFAQKIRHQRAEMLLKQQASAAKTRVNGNRAAD